MLWTPDRQTAAFAAAMRWAGTPHRHRIAIPGEGVDCIKFVLEILIAADITPRFQMPAYNPNLGILRERNIMEGLILDHLHAEARPPLAPISFGDILVFKCGEYSNHCGIILCPPDASFVTDQTTAGLKLWHCPGRGRVGPAQIPPASSVQSMIRITAPGLRADPAAITAENITERTT